jgi:CRP-like cAMP-binding protein
MPLTQEVYETLARKVELFNGLNAEDVESIFSRGMTIRVLKGETLFYKGSMGSQLYVLLGGQINIVNNKHVIATMHMGDMFGEMALVESQPRSATAVAVEDSHVFVLAEESFDRLLTKKIAVQILMNIVKIFSRRLRDANKKIAQFELITQQQQGH